jgi:hypothetical protein
MAFPSLKNMLYGGLAAAAAGAAVMFARRSANQAAPVVVSKLQTAIAAVEAAKPELPNYIALQQLETALKYFDTKATTEQADEIIFAVTTLFAANEPHVKTEDLKKIFAKESKIPNDIKEILLHVKNTAGYSLIERVSEGEQGIGEIFADAYAHDHYHESVFDYVKKLITYEHNLKNIPKNWFPKYGELKNWTDRAAEEHYLPIEVEANHLVELDQILQEENVDLKGVARHQLLDRAYQHASRNKLGSAVHIEEMKQARYALQNQAGINPEQLSNTDYLIAKVLFLKPERIDYNEKVEGLISDHEEHNAILNDNNNITKIKETLRRHTVSHVSLDSALTATADHDPDLYAILKIFNRSLQLAYKDAWFHKIAYFRHNGWGENERRALEKLADLTNKFATDVMTSGKTPAEIECLKTKYSLEAGKCLCVIRPAYREFAIKFTLFMALSSVVAGAFMEEGIGGDGFFKDDSMYFVCAALFSLVVAVYATQFYKTPVEKSTRALLSHKYTAGATVPEATNDSPAPELPRAVPGL